MNPPLVFIASSSEGEDYADGVKAILEERGDMTARHWRDVMADAQSKTGIEALADALDDYDFGVFVLSKDDVLTIRGEETPAPRDNVVLELGLFTGRLGRDRTFIIAPSDFDIRVATDLLGVVIGTYTADPNKTSAVRTAAKRVRDRILKVGPRAVPVTEGPPKDQTGSGELPGLMPPNDGWMAAARERRLVSASERDVKPGEWLVAEPIGVVQVVEILPPLQGRAASVGVSVAGHDRLFYVSESDLYRPQFE